MDKLIKRLLIFSSGVFVSLLIGEFLVRLLPQSLTKIDFGIRNDIRIFSATRGYKYKPNSSRIFTGLGSPTLWYFNNYGFRDYSFTTRSLNNTYRIIFLGDSMVMGFGVEDYQSFPKKLELDLQPENFSKGSPFYQVYNLGLWASYASDTYKAILEEEGSKLKPNLVIIGLFENDPYETAGNKINSKYNFYRALPDMVIPYQIHEFVKQHSYLYLSLLGRYYTAIEKLKSGVRFSDELVDEGWKLTDENFVQIQKIVNSLDAKLLLVGIPTRSEVIEERGKERSYKKRVSRIKEISEKHNITYFDLIDNLKKYKDKDELFINGKDDHFTPKGNELVGKILSEYLKNNNLLTKN